MFTGIIEEKGKVRQVERRRNLIVLKIVSEKIFKTTKVGDSIAVDGVCLTVSDLKNRTFTFDAMLETIQKTTLQYLKPNAEVNLERALKVGDRLGGHFVLGHIDGVGTIKQKIKKANYVEFRIDTTQKLMKYIASKGSIAIDGISLTVGNANGKVFSTHLIPYTLKKTTLGSKNVADKINIETDVLAKYLARQK